MTNLNFQTVCYTINDGQIVTGTLYDFKHFVQEACRPGGAMPKYYTTDTDSGFAVAKWESGKQVYDCSCPIHDPNYLVHPFIIWECDSEDIAEEKVVQLKIDDILNNNEFPIYLNLSDAEEALLDFY